MRRFVFDTCVLLCWLYELPVYKRINRELRIEEDDVVIILPAAAKAEWLVLITSRGWGKKRIDDTKKKISEFFLVYPNHSICDSYINASLYMRGKHPDIKLKGSANDIGDNDLWICSTAVETDATLITTDKDFLPLEGVVLNNKQYKIKNYWEYRNEK